MLLNFNFASTSGQNLRRTAVSRKQSLRLQVVHRSEQRGGEDFSYPSTKERQRATPAKARYPVNHARETKNQSLKKNLGLCVGFDAHAELVFRFDSCVTAPCVQNCCQLRAKRAESSALPRTRLRGRSWLCTCQRPCFVPLCAATARHSQRLGEASHPGPRRAKTTA